MTQEPQYREQSCPLETVEELPQRGAVSASREQDSGQRDQVKLSKWGNVGCVVVLTVLTQLLWVANQMPAGRVLFSLKVAEVIEMGFEVDKSATDN